MKDGLLYFQYDLNVIISINYNYLKNNNLNVVLFVSAINLFLLKFK